jgi:hypothetical protein
MSELHSRYAFEILDEGIPAPKGWLKVTGHLVWDVKMHFTRKEKWVLDGHKAGSKDCIVCGPEFGLENAGKIGLIHRALYEGKAAGRDF